MSERHLKLGTDKSIELTTNRRTIDVIAQDAEVKRTRIAEDFDVTAFGPIDHATREEADIHALTKLVREVIDAGATRRFEAGHRTVKHRIADVTFETYLSYAAGDKIRYSPDENGETVDLDGDDD